MKVENIIIGNIYYVTSPHNCKNCYKVQVEEIINDISVKVTSLNKAKKKNAKQKQFSLPISALHESPDKAVHGYKQHH